MSIEPEKMCVAFAEAHQRWIDAFGTNRLHHNSITNQIHRMVFEGAVFHIVNESRQYATKDACGHAELNGPLHVTLNHWFRQSQLIGIRRQLEKPKKEKGGKSDLSKGVHSLYAIVAEMRQSSALFTRRNFFAVRRLPMDVEAVKRAEREEMVRISGRIDHDAHSELQIFSNSCEESHAEFDLLSGTEATNRSPDDVVIPAIFERMLQELDSFRDLSRIATKYVAHSATPWSIKADGAEGLSYTHERLDLALEVICRVAHLVRMRLLDHADGDYAPSLSQDSCEYFDRPLAPSEHIPSLRAAWQEYESKVKRWTYGNTVAWILSSGRPHAGTGT